MPISDTSFIYFGSHGFGAKSWGSNAVKDKKITIFNWEMGILFPPMANSARMKKDIMNTLPEDFQNLELYQEGDEPFVVDPEEEEEEDTEDSEDS